MSQLTRREFLGTSAAAAAGAASGLVPSLVRELFVPYRAKASSVVLPKAYGDFYVGFDPQSPFLPVSAQNSHPAFEANKVKPYPLLQAVNSSNILFGMQYPSASGGVVTTEAQAEGELYKTLKQRGLEFRTQTRNFDAVVRLDGGRGLGVIDVIYLEDPSRYQEIRRKAGDLDVLGIPYLVMTVPPGKSMNNYVVELNAALDAFLGKPVPVVAGAAETAPSTSSQPTGQVVIIQSVIPVSYLRQGCLPMRPGNLPTFPASDRRNDELDYLFVKGENRPFATFQRRISRLAQRHFEELSGLKILRIPYNQIGRVPLTPPVPYACDGASRSF
ncbi:MAG: twin-arginine translocation signal domain-containing protein [Candidatus Aenigmarchaeota archaeon]|nr:twin-arginine translocation signal domain-containing protein [Candidatus Aenigmarchaeota archaeon]